MCRVIWKCSPTLARNAFPERVDTVHHQPSTRYNRKLWIEGVRQVAYPSS